MPRIPAPADVRIHGGGTSGGFSDRLVPRPSLRARAVDLPGRAGKPFDPMTYTAPGGVAAVLERIAAQEAAPR